MPGLIIWAFGLAALGWLVNRARWGRVSDAAGAAASCSSNWCPNSWVDRPLLTPNQLSLTGTVKDYHVEQIKLINNNKLNTREDSAGIEPG